MANKALSNVEFLGHAGGKLWLDDGRGLLRVADNAAGSGHFAQGRLPLPGGSRHKRPQLRDRTLPDADPGALACGPDRRGAFGRGALGNPPFRQAPLLVSDGAESPAPDHVGTTVAQTLDAHRSRLGQLVEQRRTTPICFAAEDVEKVGLYGQKLCYARLKERGVIRSNPYDDVTLDFTALEAGGTTAARGSGMPLVDPIGDWQSPSPVG